MQDYTIGENYVLPSLGRIYDVEVNPEIKIRSMTTEEEMKRVAVTGDAAYKNMSEIMDDCIISGNPGISAYDMCIGDYQFLLHKLRVVTYGPEYHMATRCFYCGCDTEDTLNLDDLPVLMYTEEFEKYKEFDLPVSKNHIVLRIQTPRMIDAITIRAKEFKKKYGSGMTSDPSLIFLLTELIKTVDGEYVSPIKLETWVRQLPMRDTNTIIQYAEKMNSLIGVDVNLTCTCDVCGLDFKTTLKTTQEFFRPSISF